ncbi:toxin HicA [Arthrobacter sp. H35-D1]|uniref:toxin HicA n=1 Tax=Arthrobacter sp. H35-D1 TaxID=3046202 RepID=UPI0024B95F95|nr:toxin HicA [Arthrobacter sp. H35-D1]MDJ0314078.1 toxin HicA [Arthrobacter sp. H35-D1]
MGKAEKALAKMRQNPTSVRYEDVVRVCDEYFGEPRQSGTSHRVYATPWGGDPRVNIQNKNGEAKPYQVKQVLEAVRKIEAMKAEEAESDEKDSEEGEQ